MPINSQNHKKTKSVKYALAFILVELKKLEIRIDSSYSYTCHDILTVFDNKIKDLKEGIRILEAIQFKSVDDLHSVKKLRAAELFFSTKPILNIFAFPNYKSKVNPVFLAYVDIEIQLEGLFKKSQALFYRRHHSAGNAAERLFFDLTALNHRYFNEKRMDYGDYRSKAFTMIQRARPELAQHRGCKKILGNLSLLIFTLGSAFVLNKCVSGHYLFFQQTESEKQLDKISQVVNSVRDLLPSPVYLKRIK